MGSTWSGHHFGHDLEFLWHGKHHLNCYHRPGQYNGCGNHCPSFHKTGRHHSGR